MTRSPSQATRIGVAAAAFALVATLSSTAAAQVMPIREVHIANDTDAWTVGQRAFDPNREVSIYVVFSTDRHRGFQFSGQCVVALATTNQVLHTVRVDPEWMRPGNDVLRTRSFRIAWPASPVNVTCVPDGNPAGAYTARIGVGHQVRPVATPGVILPPTGVSPGIYMPVPGVPTPTVPIADCRTILLQMGHSPAHLVQCGGAEPRCAAALLRAGHSPAHLVQCRGVQPDCAEALIRAGQSPAHLVHCR